MIGIGIGIGLSPSSAVPPQAASGYFTFAANPVDGDLMPALNGISGIVFKDAAVEFPEVGIDPHGLADTLILLASALEGAASQEGYEALSGYVYTSDATRLIITAGATGASGNSYTLGASTANITRSAATLQGGA
jgi:hypothetical protein